VKVIVQTIESWMLTPKIMGDRTGLHPVAIIVAIFFWGTAFGGVLGMLLAIPLTAFVVDRVGAWRTKVFLTAGCTGRPGRSGSSSRKFSFRPPRSSCSRIHA